MTYQQIIEMDTRGPSLKAEAVGWTLANPIPGGGHFPHTYNNVFAALQAGWRILVFPQEPAKDRIPPYPEEWVWVLYRIVDADGEPCP